LLRRSHSQPKQLAQERSGHYLVRKSSLPDAKDGQSRFPGLSKTLGRFSMRDMAGTQSMPAAPTVPPATHSRTSPRSARVADEPPAVLADDAVVGAGLAPASACDAVVPITNVASAREKVDDVDDNEVPGGGMRIPGEGDAQVDDDAGGVVNFSRARFTSQTEHTRPRLNSELDRQIASCYASAHVSDNHDGDSARESVLAPLGDEGSVPTPPKPSALTRRPTKLNMPEERVDAAAVI